MTEQPEEVPIHEGPEPRELEDAAPKLWGAVLNIEALTRISAAVGPYTPDEVDERVLGGAREFLHNALQAQRFELSEMILQAYRVHLPDAAPDLATEAVGGIRGDGDGPGDRDHLRGV